MEYTTPPPQPESPVAPTRPEPPTTSPPFFWWDPTTPPLVTRDYTIQYSTPPSQPTSPIAPPPQRVSPTVPPQPASPIAPPPQRESPTAPPPPEPPIFPPPPPLLARLSTLPKFIWVVVAAVVFFLALVLSLALLIKASKRPSNPKLKLYAITIPSLEENSFVVIPELSPISSNVRTQLSEFSVTPIYAGHAAGAMAEMEDIIISEKARTWAPRLSFSWLNSEQLRTLAFESHEGKLHVAFEISGFVETGFNEAFPHGYMGKVRWMCEGDVSLAGNRTIILDKFCH